MTDPISTVNSRIPITDVQAWLSQLPSSDTYTLKLLGQLLLGVMDRPPEETATRFTTRFLGVDGFRDVVDEDRDLNGVEALTFALAVAELIEQHSPECGPGEHTDPASWTQTAVGHTAYRHPSALRAAFPAGTLLAEPCVIKIRAKATYSYSPQITVFTRGGDRAGARAVLERIQARADELNPFRGKVCRASFDGGLKLAVIDLPTQLTRDTVVVDESVWKEIELGVAAVRDLSELLNRHGLGARRGVLLVGPPGTGKSAVSAVIARELVGTFTVIYVEARAGERLLTAVVEAAQKLGGPVLILLEDVDLWLRDRNRSGSSGGLSELLQAMDVASDAPILTLASTNDAATLDKAAVRTGRFDSIVEVGYPTRPDSARILSALIDGLPTDTVDCAAVAARLPERTSGSDLREIVRRAVLSLGGGELSTAALLAEIGSGRYQAKIPGSGTYL